MTTPISRKPTRQNNKFEHLSKKLIHYVKKATAKKRLPQRVEKGAIQKSMQPCTLGRLREIEMNFAFDGL